MFKTKTDVTLKEALKMPSTWMLLIAVIVFSWAFQLFLVHGVVHLGDIGFNNEITALSLSILIISTVIGKLGSGVIGDSIEPRFMWSGAFILTTISILLITYAKNEIYEYISPLSVHQRNQCKPKAKWFKYFQLSKLLGNILEKGRMNEEAFKTA